MLSLCSFLWCFGFTKYEIIILYIRYVISRTAGSAVAVFVVAEFSCVAGGYWVPEAAEKLGALGPAGGEGEEYRACRFKREEEEPPSVWLSC